MTNYILYTYQASARSSSVGDVVKFEETKVYSDSYSLEQVQDLILKRAEKVALSWTPGFQEYCIESLEISSVVNEWHPFAKSQA